jgi:hypothetical protein
MLEFEYFGRLTKICAFVVAALFQTAAMASTYSGELPVGYSESLFQIGGASSLAIDINAIGTRDPSLCSSCNSSYTDNYTVSLFNQAGQNLETVNETNYLYYNIYTSSHGIGAGPVFLTVPAGATSLEIQSQLYIAGLLGPNGLPLSTGNLSLSTNGSVSATPLPATFSLFATGLGVIILLVRNRTRRAAALA